MMTGVNGLDKVISSILKAKDVGLDVKVNTVVVKGWNDDEVVEFANFARRTGITVRFYRIYAIRWDRDMEKRSCF